ncbi:FGGY-family carbohydrate kinase [Streptomyces sulphureus]|uniref:FGGY-family carbohydrate kinase n=1 Tax=Streptomyces sulphureus TaxID=47758 RepID=UPI00037B93BB|nr:FGGY family carbohydrate kinase [Streptomyces sulphureus]
MDTTSGSPAPVVVGIDVATAAVRVLCVDASGRVLAEGKEPLPQPVRSGDRSEQDAGAWWPAAARALRAALSRLAGGGREVVAVAASATSGTCVLVGPEGRPLSPALMYDDRRAAELNAYAQESGAARWSALGISVGPTAALGRLAWYAQTEEVARPRGSRLLHTPDLLAERLTGGRTATDWSHSLKTGYDPLRGEWPTEVLDALGIPPSWLPDVQAPGTEVGTVCAAAAEETGLPEGASVRLGMTDGCTGQLATGAVRPGEFVGVLGTTYVLKGVTRELVTDPSGAVYSHRHPDGWWLPGGASNTGGEALGWFDWSRFPELDAAAAARGPASFVSYPLRREGERFPFVSSAARGFTTGTPADDAERHRADQEGVAFLERLALERVAELGVAVEGPLHAAGGGSRSALWTRIRATVLGRELRVVDRAETAFGAALLAAAGTLYGNLSEAASAMVGPGRTVEPEPREQQALEESYGEFVGALRERGLL